MRKQKLTPELIINIVCKVAGMSDSRIKAPTRKREIVEARQAAMYFIRENFPLLTYKKIGQMFNGKEHATVIHAIRCVENVKDKEFNGLVEKVRMKIEYSDIPLVERLFHDFPENNPLYKDSGLWKMRGDDVIVQQENESFNDFIFRCKRAKQVVIREDSTLQPTFKYE